MLEQVLESIGLSQKESKVYLSMIELGTQPVSIIAKKAKLNRTTTYIIIENLSEKGLVTSLTKQKTLYYSANSPEHFLLYLKNKKEKIKQQESLLKANLQAFQLITENRNIKPKVQFFDGFEGIKAIYLETLKTQETIKAFWGIHTIPDQLHEFIFKEYIPKRIKNKIFIDVITPKTPEAVKLAQKDKQHLRKSYFFDKNLPFTIEINIFDDKIAFMSYSEEEYSGVLIENKKIATALKTIHTLTKLYSNSQK